MKSSCLFKDKMDFNKTGNSIFSKNILSVLKRALSSTKHIEQINGTFLLMHLPLVLNMSRTLMLT